MVGMAIPPGKSTGGSSRQHEYYFADDQDDEEVRPEQDGDDDAETANTPMSSPSNSPRGRPETPMGQHWPQSYRASMDAYTGSSFRSTGLFSPHQSGANTPVSPFFVRWNSNNSRLNHTASEPESALERAASPLLPDKQPVRPESDAQLPLPPLQSKPYERLPSVKSLPPESAYFDPEELEVGSSTFMQALFNGMNVLAGVGVLSTPYGLAQGGWLGLGILLLLAVSCCYTGILLSRCLQSSPHVHTYPDIGQAAFGLTGRLLISTLFYFEVYACCVEFLILEGDNLSSLFPGASISVLGAPLESKTFFMLLTAIAVLPTVWLKNLSLLSYISALGVLAAALVVFAVAWIGEFNGVGFNQTGPLVRWGTLPVSVGLFGFCYSGHAVFPNIYNSMADKRQFPLLLTATFALCTLIYGGIAVTGFTMFGEETRSQITLNLPKQFVASKIAIWTTVVNPFTKFALTMTPVAMAVEELVPLSVSPSRFTTFSYIIRTGLVGSTVLVALLVPFFGYVMAFIGSFLSMTVSVILPCACYLRIYGKRVSLLQTIICVCIMVLGTVAAGFGTWSAVSGIAGSFHPHTPPTSVPRLPW